LTHDYLVHSIREWLTRKQKESRRGRAELLLADRAVVWNARPENRQLPSLLQWVQIRWLTVKKNWTPPQKKMMGKAGRYHAVRGAVMAVLLAVATFTGLVIREKVDEQRKATQAAGLVQSLLNADTAQVPAIVGEMKEYRQWADPLLREESDKAEAKSRQKLHVSLALLPVDPGQVDYLYGRLLDAQPHEVPVIRDALGPQKDALLDKLWAVVETPENGKESQRLRAAAALAKYDPESEKWKTCGPLVVNDLVLENPLFLGQLSEMYRPAKNSLLDPLTVIFRDRNPERASERTLATNLLADYAADNPAKLADLIMDADDKQFAVIYPKLKERRAQGLPLLTGEIDRKLPADMPSSDEKREKLAKRQANAAVALLKMGQAEKVWPLLKRSKEPDDPRVRSYLIHGFGSLGAEAGAIIKRLDDEPDITIRRALILSLGEFNEKELPPDAEKALLEKLKAMYRRDADPGLHAASEWLLRRWKEETWLKQENEEWAKDKEQTEKRLDGIKQLITKEKERTPPQWYVNGQGQTMVVIPGPVEFLMGSPPTEAGRELRENQHKRRIGRTFALAAKSVTLAEYQRFDPGYGGETQQWSPTGDCPVLGISWFQAAAYCNWLSKQEGLPESEWCYEPLREAKAVPVLGYKVGMKLAANYLKRSGYRLPTEAEMEFATRAGSVASRYYGETEELLPKYAWYNKNGRDRSWPVGSKKPNDFGLFDVQGNVFTWCQESFKPYPKSKENETTEDEEDVLSINLDNRGLRGGSFGVQASVVRSAFRQGVVPTYRSDGDVGVRPARTLPP